MADIEECIGSPIAPAHGGKQRGQGLAGKRAACNLYFLFTTTPKALSVIPAQAGIYANHRCSSAIDASDGPAKLLREAVGTLRVARRHEIAWIPACAGMTEMRAWQ